METYAIMTGAASSSAWRMSSRVTVIGHLPPRAPLTCEVAYATTTFEDTELRTAKSEVYEALVTRINRIIVHGICQIAS